MDSLNYLASSHTAGKLSPIVGVLYGNLIHNFQLSIAPSASTDMHVGEIPPN